VRADGVERNIESRNTSGRPLDAAAKTNHRYEEEVQINFKGLNFRLLGVLLAETAADTSWLSATAVGCVGHRRGISPLRALRRLLQG
jgi:hypothetical protein